MLNRMVFFLYVGGSPNVIGVVKRLNLEFWHEVRFHKLKNVINNNALTSSLPGYPDYEFKCSTRLAMKYM